MGKIDSKDFELQGRWIFENGKVVEDEVSIRINYLKNNYLLKIAVSSSGWETLYQDPKDKRYWELRYLNSELQGGGPPSLFCISKDEAIKKYF